MPLLSSGLYRWPWNFTKSCSITIELAGFTASRRNYRRPEAGYIIYRFMDTAMPVLEK